MRPWDEVGTTYYMVVAAGSPAPTSDDVKHLRAAAGSTALACGVFAVAEGFLNVTQHVQGVNVTVRPARYCSPRHQTCFEPWYPELSVHAP